MKGCGFPDFTVSIAASAEPNSIIRTDSVIIGRRDDFGPHFARGVEILNQSLLADLII